MTLYDTDYKTVLTADDFVAKYDMIYSYLNADSENLEQKMITYLNTSFPTDKDEIRDAVRNILLWKTGGLLSYDKKTVKYRNSHIDIDQVVSAVEGLNYYDDKSGFLPELFKRLNKIKGIGPVITITLAYFMSNGELPIYDRFAHIALLAINEIDLKDKVTADFFYTNDYINSVSITSDLSIQENLHRYSLYRDRIRRLNQQMGISNGVDKDRSIDQALWTYGHLFNETKIREARRKGIENIGSNILFYELGKSLLDKKKIFQQLSGCGCIWIYGSGFVGRLVCRYLIDHRLDNKLNGFLDSKKTNVNVEVGWNSYHVTCVDEAEVRPDDMIIVAVTQKYRKEILSKCKKEGFKNVLPVTAFDSRDENYYKSIPEEQYRDEIEYSYKITTGHTLHLDHPKTYNDWINRVKLYDYTPLMTRLADKYEVRNRVSEKIGEQYLTRLYGVWNRAEDVDFQSLPEKYAIKCNHGCGWNIIVKDHVNEEQIADMRKQLDEWMHDNFAYHSLELQYRDIKPRIIAEEYLENADGDLFDYKVFCLHGEPKYIMFLAERQSGHLKMAFYDTQWRKQPFVYSYERYEKDVPRPHNLEKMLELSRILSKGFAQVRVDWYDLPGDILKFGEMTFTSCNGMAKWDPPKYDRILGDMI